jgi:murein DD-endopeptidase MepM/ murein hydrolase activator NlpD
MAKLPLYFPVKPLHINQAFGANYDYYHTNFGTNGHMGIDLMALHGQPVYAPIDGTATYTTDSHGGEGVTIFSDTPYEYENGKCWFNVILWHLVGDTDPQYPKPFTQPTKVNVGDLIGYANNTGAPFESTGDHLHMGLIPVDMRGRALMPGNGFGGNIDPQPYFNGQFSVDVLIGLYQKLIALLQRLLPFLK